MIDKFGNVFYLIIYLAHFIIVGSYGYQLVFDTKKFLKGRGVDKTATLITRFAGQNSNAFQFASRIHQTFKQSLYLYEIRKSLDKPVEFKVVKYLKNETLPKLDDKNLSLFLQSKVKFSH